MVNASYGGYRTVLKPGGTAVPRVFHCNNTQYGGGVIADSAPLQIGTNGVFSAFTWVRFINNSTEQGYVFSKGFGLFYDPTSYGMFIVDGMSSSASIRRNTGMNVGTQLPVNVINGWMPIGLVVDATLAATTGTTIKMYMGGAASSQTSAGFQQVSGQAGTVDGWWAQMNVGNITINSSVGNNYVIGNRYDQISVATYQLECWMYRHRFWNRAVTLQEFHAEAAGTPLSSSSTGLLIDLTMTNGNAPGSYITNTSPAGTLSGNGTVGDMLISSGAGWTTPPAIPVVSSSQHATLMTRQNGLGYQATPAAIGTGGPTNVAPSVNTSVMPFLPHQILANAT